MDIIDAIKSRKSIRGFKHEHVPKEIITNILEIAKWAPSSVNTQPWEFVVVTGEPLQNIRNKNIEKLHAGENADPAVAGTFTGIYRVRQVELAKHIFQIMDIPREDKVKRDAWRERGFRYFDAPVAIIIFIDKALAETESALDVGAFTQNICLAALNFGLGTCIHSQGVMYPDVVKQYTNIPESKRLIVAISIGYPDHENIVNTITSTRESSVDNPKTWVGFP